MVSSKKKSLVNYLSYWCDNNGLEKEFLICEKSELLQYNILNNDSIRCIIEIETYLKGILNLKKILKEVQISTICQRPILCTFLYQKYLELSINYKNNFASHLE